MTTPGRDAERDSAGVRVPPPLIYLVPLLLGLWLDRWVPIAALPHGAARVAAIACFLASTVMVFAVVAFHRAGTRPEPWKPAAALVTSGPYRVSRNPMYLGFTALYLGVAFWFGSAWVLLLLPLVLLAMQRGVIAREEAYLERRFGEAYREYRGRVRRWV